MMLCNCNNIICFLISIAFVLYNLPPPRPHMNEKLTQTKFRRCPYAEGMMEFRVARLAIVMIVRTPRRRPSKLTRLQVLYISGPFPISALAAPQPFPFPRLLKKGSSQNQSSFSPPSIADCEQCSVRDGSLSYAGHVALEPKNNTHTQTMALFNRQPGPWLFGNLKKTGLISGVLDKTK